MLRTPTPTTMMSTVSGNETKVPREDDDDRVVEEEEENIIAGKRTPMGRRDR